MLKINGIKLFVLLLSIMNISSKISNADKDEYVNILVLNGACNSNLITAQILNRTEQYINNLVEEEGLDAKMYSIKNDENKRLSFAFADLFDMISGVSTSSFMAIGLSLPSPYNKTEPKYFAGDIVDMYIKKRMTFSSLIRIKNYTVVYLVYVILCCVLSW